MKRKLLTILRQDSGAEYSIKYVDQKSWTAFIHLKSEDRINQFAHDPSIALVKIRFSDGKIKIIENIL